MMKFLKAIASSLKLDAAQLIVLIPCVVIVVFAYGCEPKAKSVLHPGEKVTRAELQLELDQYLQLAEIRFDDLDKQEKFREFLFTQTLIIGQSGGVNPIGILTSLWALVGTGAMIDNRRKAKVIKNVVKENPNKDID